MAGGSPKRKRKTKIKVNDETSLEHLMQEAYDDSCNQINESQDNIADLKGKTITNTEVEDLVKIAREKSNALKLKENAIKIKLDIAKLQSDIIKIKMGKIKNDEDDEKGTSITDGQSPDLNHLSDLRQFLENKKNNKN